VFFPYKDDNPRVLFPFVTYGIIGINILVFWAQFFVYGNERLISTFAFVPYEFKLFTIFTSMFMHGGLMHIIGNMWFLYIFGDNVESILGHVRFLLFYLFCGIGAAVAQFLIQPDSTTPMVGASGAIAGVLGAYMIKFPKARVHVLAVIFIFITTIVVPAQLVLGLWFLMQLSGGLGSLGFDTTGGIAWFAHIGGFIVGISTLTIFQTINIKKI
jgi:membrane associated rhomboid family serine protease